MNQITIGAIMAESKGNPDMNEDLIRHMVLNSLRMIKNKHSDEYGEIVICYDATSSWRKEVFKYYKQNRKEQRSKSTVDWGRLFEILNTIKSEITEHMPYKVISVENCESDDIIATLTKKYHTNEKILIVSSDGDFQQLQKYENVQQYSPIHKKLLKCENADEYLFEHIIKGDASDGIPNILSKDDIFLDKDHRQASVTSKRYQTFHKKWTDSSFVVSGRDIFTIADDAQTLSNIQRNVTLIDFNSIPKEIQETILNTYKSIIPQKRDKILNYFMLKNMKNMIQHVVEF